ncbi:fused MFS/spermidine synthase [Stieleria varia]|uniref:Spermidine synthase n=1 Tax=Stieleria varia TaxID=2528005 RepID=A0A5C6AYE2_9BACT|nr:fused MFS/spermidine synthase [Stieleria varia]TWU04983.1 Spermidine synthase [Stieleria varia]
MIEGKAEGNAAPSKFACLLFISGACALVYQVVWIRELRLVFGATTSSSAAVLAIFMAGLGIGNVVLGRRIEGTLKPVRFYAMLEFGIAIFAAISPWMIDIARYAYVSVGGQSSLGIGLATMIRLVASAAILAAPTFLMGGTMPAAALAVSVDSDARRKGVAMIYALNTLGAVTGAGLANFVLIEWLGNRSVLWSACFINLLLAVTAIRYSSQLIAIPHTRSAVNPRNAKQAVDEDGAIDQGTENRLPLVCISAAVVGFVFFLMEIVWYRMLGPLLGGTTYTFGLILCVALLGIGVGGALYNLFVRWGKPTLPLLSITCLLEACFIAVPLWFGDQVAMWVLQQQNEVIDSFVDQVWNWFQIASFVILPASIVAGFQFPLLIAVAGKGRQHVAKHVGWTFASNTVGAICGSLAGGFLLMPILTAPGIWRAAIIVLVVWGMVVVTYSRLSRKLFLPFFAFGAVLLLVAIQAEGPTAVWRHAGIGAGRADLEGVGRNAEKNFINAKRRQCIWEAEGVESSVAITATDSLSFIVNGKNDGNAYNDAGTQVGLGLLGPLLHLSPKRGLVIGLGTGETAGWMAACEEVESVDVVELEPVIMHMAEQCRAMNKDALANPKVQTHFNDAREFLLSGRGAYDVIVSEPSNPYRVGIANLYTTEFYSSALDRLTEDGIFLQWLQAYEVDDRTVAIVLKTLRTVFPHVEVWRAKSRDLVLVCGKSRFPIWDDEAFIRRRTQLPAIREGLNLGWRVDDLEGVIAHYVCGLKTVEKWTNDEDIPVNSDDRNLLEYAFAKSLGQKTRFSSEALHRLARTMGDSTPLSKDCLDLKQIARRQLAMNLYLGHEVPAESKNSDDQQLRSEAYRSYLTQNYQEAARLFGGINVDFGCPIERLVYSHTLAETGTSLPTDLMDVLRISNAGEAAAIETVSYMKRNERELGRKAILATILQMQSSPWGSRQLFESVLRNAVDAASTDIDFARLLFSQLKEPFSMYRLEDMRLLTRYVISENLGQAEMIDALSHFEPYVPWKEWLLEERAALYTREGSPFAGRADADLQQFRTWAQR